MLANFVALDEAVEVQVWTTAAHENEQATQSMQREFTDIWRRSNSWGNTDVNSRSYRTTQSFDTMVHTKNNKYKTTVE